MHIYLPIAQMSVNWGVLIALGLAVGFLSGMLGVSGGFITTPLLIFMVFRLRLPSQVRQAPSLRPRLSAPFGKAAGNRWITRWAHGCWWVA